MANQTLQQNRSTTRGIKICSINICGLSNRSKLMLDKYANDEKVDILLVQESGSKDKSEISLTNMKTFMDTNKSANRGSVLYVRNNITATNLTEIPKMSKQIDSAWSITVINNKRYIIGSVYVKLNYKQAISEVIKMLNKAHQMKEKMKACGVLLIGDFNARHKLWGDEVNNEYGKQLVDLLDNNLFSIIKSETPTFLCDKGSSHIDFMIVSNNISGKLQGCHTDELAELYSGAPLRGHVPLIATLQEDRDRKTTTVEEKMDIKSVNWQEWSRELEEVISTSDVDTDNIGDPTEIWDFMERKIGEVNRKCCKMKKTTRHSKPYWNNDLTQLCNKMRAARKTYMKRNTDRNKELMVESKERFDLERKKVCDNFILEKTKALNAAESLQFWKQFNSLFKSKSEKGIDPLNDEDKGILTENSEIEEKLFSTFFEARHLDAADFDDTFYETVTNLYEDIKHNNFEDEANSGLSDSLNAPITIKEIKNAIKRTNCSSKKSLDNHSMHPKMLHSFGPNTLNLLKKLFNKCMTSGHWVWNTAQVIFLKKDGKESYAIPGSYRPISISSYVGKLLEKIIADRVNAFLETGSIFDPDQEGFTRWRNTVRYLNRLNLEIKSDLLKKFTVIALFIDFEKAFDSIWKKGLIVKLANLNIKGNILRLVDNFLTNRKVRLNINGEIGEMRDSKEYGLPQGSALSPVLFKLYLLDILEEINGRSDIQFYKFADDGTVKMRNESTQMCMETFEEVMILLHNWTRRWRMVINCQPNKTEFMCMGVGDGNTGAIPDRIKLGDKEIKQVAETKVLGLTMDKELSYTSHSNIVYKNIAGKWANICKYSNRHWGFNQHVIRQIASTFLLSSINYAGMVWMNSRNTTELEKLWYKIMKAATGATFNLRKSVAEVIIGIPPIAIQNQINKTKHYLKLNISRAEEDRLREFILESYSRQDIATVPVELRSSFKDLFKFLSWKLEEIPSDFSMQDRDIVENNKFEEYFELTKQSCRYTKDMISKFTEKLWYSAVRNEFTLQGYNNVPKPTSKRLPIPKGTPRSEEVLLMSLFYQNNLFNSHMYRHTYLVESPLCRKCKQQEETPHHIILECSEKAHQARRLLMEIIDEEELQQDDTVSLLNGSRNEQFIKICLDILSENQYCDSYELT